MNRRLFLKHALPAGTIPFLINGFSLSAYGRSPFMDALTALAAETDRVLVLVQLNGGNDGLNMVIPLDRYAALSAARSNILIPEAKVLQLTAATGLHPEMAGMHDIYRQGQMAVVQGVGYPSPNFSHFRATDIWLTGSDSNQVLSTGWLGRYLEREYPGFPNGYPTEAMPDPLAIQIGAVVSVGLQGEAGSMALAITNPNAAYTFPGGSDTPPTTPAGHELAFIRQVAEQTQKYSTVIRAAAAKGTNKSPLYPAAGQNTLADQLKIVAQLVAGGLKTRVYVVSLGGFDTHSGQVDAGAPESGVHARLLGRLSVGVTAFMDDLRLLGADHRVVGMTFSEFGRRIKSNASSGTDHGAAAPVFVFGSKVQGGIVGSNPVIPANATVNDNVALQHDYRKVYATLLRNWLGASPSVVQNVLPGHTETLPLIQPGAITNAGRDQQLPHRFALQQNFPNPFNPETTIRYELPERAPVVLEVFDVSGHTVKTLVRGECAAGTHTVQMRAEGLASGVYFYRLTAGAFVETRRMVVVR